MGKPLDCDTPSYHDLHVCKLRKLGAEEEIRRRAEHPAVRCRNCGALAARDRDVCKPEPL